MRLSVFGLKNWSFLLIFVGSSALAQPNPSPIVEIHPGTPGDAASEHLVFYADGQVQFLKNHEHKKLTQLLQRFQAQEKQAPFLIPYEIPTYEPSVISSERATEIFNSMNRRVRRTSQCFNRALIWGYEAWKKNDLKSMKVFMFFTEKYIRDYHYHWWFHSSPFTWVETPQGPEERILDRYFMSGPVTFKTWSDYFIQPKTPCPTVDHYTDYSEHQQDQYCYFIKVPMFYWQPKDVEARDRGEPHAHEFIKEEVDAAYKQGFKASATH
jgi:hypothetical protein